MKRMWQGMGSVPRSLSRMRGANVPRRGPLDLSRHGGHTPLGVAAAAQRRAEGQLIIAFDASIATAFLDPSEATAVTTSSIFLYTRHDALLKPCRGSPMVRRPKPLSSGWSRASA
jgi:hypothetical protein